MKFSSFHFHLAFGGRGCGSLKKFCNLFLWITLLFFLLVKKSFIGQNKSFFGPLELVEKLCPEASDIATSVRNLPELKWVRSSSANLMIFKTPHIYSFLNSLLMKPFLIGKSSLLIIHMISSKIWLSLSLSFLFFKMGTVIPACHTGQIGWKGVVNQRALTGGKGTTGTLPESLLQTQVGSFLNNTFWARL